MQTQRDIEEMADEAKLAAGWAEDGYVPLGHSDGLGGLSSEYDEDQDREDRAYAEGVEAGLRWALGWADKPLPR